MTTAIVSRSQKLEALDSQLETMKSKFQMIQPVTGIDAGMMRRMAMSVVGKEPKLLDVNRLSLLTCVLKCAELGLYPQDVLGLAYILPFGNKAQLMIGYKGFYKLAFNSGKVASFHTKTVFEWDQYEPPAEGTSRGIVHVPKLNSKQAEADTIPIEKIVGAYAIAQIHPYHPGDDPVYEWVFLDRVTIIRDHRNRSAAWRRNKAGPWLDYPPQMCEKTASRVLTGRLNLSPQSEQAAALDGQAQVGEDQRLDKDPVLVEAVAEVLDESEVKTDPLRAAAEEAKKKPPAASSKQYPADPKDAFTMYQGMIARAARAGHNDLLKKQTGCTAWEEVETRLFGTVEASERILSSDLYGWIDECEKLLG